VESTRQHTVIAAAAAVEAAAFKAGETATFEFEQHDQYNHCSYDEYASNDDQSYLPRLQQHVAT